MAHYDSREVQNKLVDPTLGAVPLDVAARGIPRVLQVVCVPPSARELLLQRLAAVRAVVLRIAVVTLPAGSANEVMEP